MCSGRVDLEFIFRAFARGEDGVFIGGCRLDECNYITHGNYDTMANTYIAKRLLKHIGVNPGRLRTEFMSGADGNLLAEYTDDFSREIKAFGPLGQKEGLSSDELAVKLEAVRKLIPYLRLAERERLRVPEKTKKAYTRFFKSSETKELFDKIVSDKLAISQILLLLKKKALSTNEIAQNLGLNPSDVSRHINTSSRQGLVKYDTAGNCYKLA